MNEILKAGLPPAQARVAELLVEGLTNPEMARRLGIQERTVKAHLHHLFLKFQIEAPDGGKSNKRILLAKKLLCA